MSGPTLPSLPPANVLVEDALLFGDEELYEGRNLSRKLRLDPSEWASRLEFVSQRQASAIARSRALAAAAIVHRATGSRADASDCAERAAQTLPKLAVLTLLSRSLSVGSTPDEVVLHTLEQAYRQSDSASARSYAIQKAIEICQAGGDIERARAFIEQGSRTLTDPWIDAYRLFFSLAGGDPTLGLRAPASLEAAMPIVREIVSKGTEAAAPPPGLLFLRALRARRSRDFAGYVEGIGAYLTSIPEQPEALSHVWLLLMSTHPRLAPHALSRIKERVEARQASPFLRRLLAFLAMKADDRAGLALVLDADASADTSIFEFEERELLGCFAGVNLPGPGTGPRPRENASPLEWALARLPFSETDSWNSARAALGACLGRLTAPEAEPVIDDWQSRDPIATERLLKPLIALERARNDGVEAAAVLAGILETHESPELALLVATQKALIGADDEAEKAFETAWSSRDPDLRHAALIGLESLSGPSPSLAHRRVELARELPTEARAQLLFDAALDLDRIEGAAALRELAETKDAGTLATEAALLISFLEEKMALGSLARGDALEALLEIEGGSLRDVGATLLALFSESAETALALARTSAKGQSTPLLQLLKSSVRITSGAPPEGSGTALDIVERVTDAWLRGERRQALQDLSSLITEQSALLRDFRRHLELSLGETGSSTIHLLDQAPDVSSPEARRNTLQALIHYDAARGDSSSVEMWRHILVDEGLATVQVHLDVEHRTLEARSLPLIRSLFPELTLGLPLPDREPYLLVEAAFCLGGSDLRGARRALEKLGEPSRLPSFALRALITEAWDRADLTRVRQLERELSLRSTKAEDKLLLCTELARLGLARGEREEALADLDEAVSAEERAFAPRLLKVEALEIGDDGEEGSEALFEQAAAADGLAEVSHFLEHRLLSLMRAGNAFEQAGDLASARARFEACLAQRPDSEEAFTRLRHLYQEDEDALVGLLLQRLEQPISQLARLELALEAGELLARLERHEEAERLYGETVKTHPTDPRVLLAHAQSAEALLRFAEASLSYKRLADVRSSEDSRIFALFKVARISSEKLERHEAAMDAYEAILRSQPENLTAMQELVHVFIRLELAERAAELQTKVIARTESMDEKIWAALQLAEIYRTSARDPGRAAVTLERASRAWPLDSRVLAARAELLAETNETSARRMLVDRTGKEARRQLESGRLEIGLLETVGLATDLLGGRAQAEATYAAIRILRAEPEVRAQAPAGASVFAPEIEPLLSPKELSPALRQLLQRTKGALDLTLPLDAASLAPKPKGPLTGATFARILPALGITSYEVLTSESLGPKMIVLSSSPLRFIAGAAVETLSEQSRTFLVLRAIKHELMGTGALFRGKPENAWPTIVALLLIFAPGYRPEGADARRVMQAQAQLERGFARLGYEDLVPTLAMEAVGGLGSQRNAVFSGLAALANRTAFLGIGSLLASIEAMALESKPVPPEGPNRLRWFELMPEAKDLLLFSTTESMQRALEILAKRAGRTS